MNPESDFTENNHANVRHRFVCLHRMIEFRRCSLSLASFNLFNISSVDCLVLK